MRVAEALGQGVIVQLEAVVLKGGRRDDGRWLRHLGRRRGRSGRRHHVLERHHGAGGDEALRRGVVAAHDGDGLSLAAGAEFGRPAGRPSDRPPPHHSPRAHRGTAEEAKQQLYLEKYLPTDVLLRFFRVPGLTFSRGGSFSL